MLNQLILLGRLTKEPQLRTATSGRNVASFSLAFDNVMKNPDGSRGTSFIDCVAFDTTAEVIVKFAHKGDKIAVVGSVNQRHWTGKDGKEYSNIEVLVSSIELLEPKKEIPAPNPEEFATGLPTDEERPPLAEGWEYGEDGKPRRKKSASAKK